MNAFELPLTLPATSKRVEQSTADKINAKIERETAENVIRVADKPYAITLRLKELNKEWDVERTLEANASTLILLSLGLGFKVSPKWFVLPVFVSGFLLQHALQGWCPPLPILRRLGIRTEREINIERTALRILRGDFYHSTHDPMEALALAKDGM